MNKLYKILDATKIVNNFELKYFEDIEISLHKEDNKFTFTISTYKLIPLSTYLKIRKFNFEDLEFFVNIKYFNDINSEIIYDVLKYISSLFPYKKLFLKNIEKKSTTISNNILNFYYCLEDEKSEIDSLYQEIKNIFLSYLGIELIAFQYFIDENFLNYQKNLKEIEEKNIATAITKANQRQEEKKKTNFVNSINDKMSGKKVKLKDIEYEQNSLIVEGEIFKIEYEERTKFFFHKIYINDYESTFMMKYLYFPDENGNIKSQNEQMRQLLNQFKIGDWINAQIDSKTDKYEQEIYGLIKKIKKIEIPLEYRIEDLESEKRTELTVHTKMSAFDGVIDLEELFSTLNKYGHKAVGISDRYNVQCYPEVQKLSKKYNIKPIYGCEFEVIKEQLECALNTDSSKINDNTYVVFDLETTGLFPEFDEIIEFGAIKCKEGKIIDKVDFFIKPSNPLSSFTQSLTGIKNSDVENAISQKEGIIKILEWIGHYPLIAHNAIDFDFNFIVKKSEQFSLPIPKNMVIDTLHISRGLFPEFKSHTLGKMCAKFSIDYDEVSAHRADYDAEVLFHLWNNLVRIMGEKNINYVEQINSLTSDKLKSRYRSNFINIYAKNQNSLKNIYKLVSLSHTDNYSFKPLISYSNIDMYRQDLIIANSPIDGDIWYHALYSPEDILKKAINFYDYIFVAPPNCYSHLLDGTNDITIEKIQNIIKKIIDISLSLNKKVIAVSDAHYLHSWDKKYYDVYIYAKALGGTRHRYYRNKKSPDLFLRTTSQMLKEFEFLNNNELLKNIVVNNSKEFIDSIDSEIYPIKDKLYTPHIDNVEKMINDYVYKKAHKIYGDILPEIVDARLKKELDSIIGNGYSVVYWISHLLVKKSLDEGYVVGSRGSVGSSLVATMLEITDVNPLPAHYYCKNCRYVEFVDNCDDGYDLDDKNCPNCHEHLIGDGHNIPFETFLGFKGDKVPDIDLNFSGEYQAKAHNFIKEMFGDLHAFRAGTISTIAEKTAFGHIKAYFEEINELDVKPSTMSLYVEKCRDVKKTTGQHPGGILIVPKEYSIYDFSPFNFPADDNTSTWYTTHFAFEYLHDNLLKFDILGHDNPTILRQLKQLTNVDMYDIPNNDKNVINLFTSIEPLKIVDNNCINEENGAISLPEFGTKFVREMLNYTKPKSFADLIRISGLSHGTDVYVGNAKSLIKEKGLKLENVISCRDDIMNYLIDKNIDPSISFKIMEDVRKGKGLKDEYVDIMLKNSVPQWYIDSCNKIKYMFPKAHATAYVQHAYKFAWYKIYHPLPYYATYFSNKPDAIEIATLCNGRDEILNRQKQIKELISTNKASKKEQDLDVNFTVALEMIARGFKFYKPNIFKSDSTKFIILKDGLLAPFNSIDGIGETAAQSVIDARNECPFKSLDDLRRRTKLNNTNIQALIDIGSLDDLPESEQIKLF